MSAASSFREAAEWVDPLRPPQRLRGRITGTTPGFISDPKKGLIESHQWRPADRDRRHSLRTVLDRYGDRSSVHRLLYYNSWLLNSPFEETAVADRAEEIGRAVAEGYDIAGLAELYDERERNIFREGLGGTGRTSRFDEALGVTESFLKKGSGLLTVCARDGREIGGRIQTHEFEETGMIADIGSWARKGVLRTPVDVGVGTVEFYTTHLSSGAGVDGGFDYHKLRDDPRANHIRLAQVGELCSFVEETHNPANVAVIAGDFNIPADTEFYDQLIEVMSEIGFRDLWSTNGGPTGHTYLKTNEDDVTDICAVETTAGPHYCDDYDGQDLPESESHRIDYLFVEEPTDRHRFDLDLSRVRRRSFWRGLSGRVGPFESESGVNFLSDHVGLDVELRTS